MLLQEPGYRLVPRNYFPCRSLTSKTTSSADTSKTEVGLPNFRDGTGNLTYLKSGIKLLKFCSLYPGSSVQCIVHIPIDNIGGEGHVKGGVELPRNVCMRKKLRFG